MQKIVGLGETTNNSGEKDKEGRTLPVNGNIEALSFTECNVTVTVLAKGTLSVTGAGGNNGSLSSSGTEVTVEFAGFHCIFKNQRHRARYRHRFSEHQRQRHTGHLRDDSADRR